MAEINHTSSATNNDREASSPSVPSDAAKAPEGLTRRTAMTMMTAVTATPALALVPTSPTPPKRVDRRRWDRAVELYERHHAEFDRLWDVHEAACEQMPERVDRYFDEYRLGMGMKRDHVHNTLLYHFANKYGYSGLIVYPPQASRECEEKVARMKEDADRETDAFMAYQEHHQRERDRLRIEELSEAAHLYGDDHYFPAREALMEVPAPDQAALIYKFEIAATSLDDVHMESCLADAKRLLGRTSN